MENGAVRHRYPWSAYVRQRRSVGPDAPGVVFVDVGPDVDVAAAAEDHERLTRGAALRVLARAHTVLQEPAPGRNGFRSTIRPEDRATLEPWLQFWYVWVSAAFLRAYLGIARTGHFLPPSRAEVGILLDAFMLQKAVYELGYELQEVTPAVAPSRSWGRGR